MLRKPKNSYNAKINPVEGAYNEIVNIPYMREKGIKWGGKAVLLDTWAC